MSSTGVGASLAFTSGLSFTARWRSVDAIRITNESLEDSSLASTNFMEFVPDDLDDVEEITIEFYFDATDSLPVRRTTGTLTITFPLQDSQTSNATLVGTGFITAVDVPPLAVGERLIGSLTFKFDGKTEPAFSVAS